MRNLELFISLENKQRALFGFDLIKMPPSKRVCESLLESLDEKRSSENMKKCGEASEAEMKEKFLFYSNVRSEIEEHLGLPTSHESLKRWLVNR